MELKIVTAKAKPSNRQRSTKPTGKFDAKSQSSRARETLLAAAENCLGESGYSGFSTRRVAEIGGVPLSQIHYHFGSKQGLLLALFEKLNERLLLRQRDMFNSERSLSAQWEMACDYLDQDLASGYVRILNELTTAGWSDPEIGAQIRHAIGNWESLIREVCERACNHFELGSRVSANELTALISAIFLGAEVCLLSGHESEELPIRGALRKVGLLIRLVE